MQASKKSGKQVKVFYTMPEYEAWKEETGNNAQGWVIKYYKGLGTSNSKEAKEYFAALDDHRKTFVWEGTIKASSVSFSRRGSGGDGVFSTCHNELHTVV
jgi:DNA topoisomerase II